MSNKHSRSEDEGGHANPPAKRSKLLVDADGMPRKETLKEQMKRLRKEKKAVKQSEKAAKREKSRKTSPGPKSDKRDYKKIALKAARCAEIEAKEREEWLAKNGERGEVKEEKEKKEVKVKEEVKKVEQVKEEAEPDVEMKDVAETEAQAQERKKSKKMRKREKKEKKRTEQEKMEREEKEKEGKIEVEEEVKEEVKEVKEEVKEVKEVKEEVKEVKMEDEVKEEVVEKTKDKRAKDKKVKEKKGKKGLSPSDDAVKTTETDKVKEEVKEVKEVKMEEVKEEVEEVIEEKPKEKKEKAKKAKKEKKVKEEKEVVEKPKEKKKDKKEKEASSFADFTIKAPPYTQTAVLTAVPESEIAAFLKKEQVAISDPKGSTLRPILEFGQLPASRLTKQGPFAAYKAPTPIQAASWPYSLSGRDLVGIAETGSGKTMAFAVPCLEALERAARPAAVEATRRLPSRSRLNGKGEAGHTGHVAQPRAVVVSPTRELAMQTHAAMVPLAAAVGLTAVCLFGGASKDDQRVLLRQKAGVDIVVATPGRLKDFLSDEAVSLAHVCFAVLDEADRMLDTGFEEDIRTILGQCPAREARQTLMFTATWPTSVRGLAETFMVDPVKITVGSKTRAGADGAEGDAFGSTELQANARIAQTVEVLEQHAKERRLLQIVKQEQRGKAKNDRILVFCLYKKEAVRVENFLQGQGVRVCSIHGNLRQEQRTQSLEAFKSGQTPVLVATDVAARGLDIPEVKLVINVTFPLTIEDYVHRIGRTGRAGKDGRAITFFTEHDKAHSGSLVNILKGANQEVPEDLLKFGTTVKKKAHGTYGAFFKDVDMSQKGTKITFD